MSDEPRPKTAAWIYGIGFVLAVAIGPSLWIASRPRAPGSGPLPSPQLVVMVASDDLWRADVRTALCDFDRDLRKISGIRVSGPTSYPIFLKGKARQTTATGLQPQGKPVMLDTLEAEEVDAASRGLERGRYLIPRVICADQKRAVLRAGAVGSAFPPETRAAVDALLEKYRASFAGTWAYSPALGLVDVEARDAINEDFGVRVGMIRLEGEEEGAFWKAATLEAVEAKVAGFSHPTVRAVVGPASSFLYARKPLFKAAGASLTDQEVLVIRGFAQLVGAPLGVSADGKSAFVEVYTTAEGDAFHEVCHAAAVELSGIPGVRVVGLSDSDK